MSAEAEIPQSSTDILISTLSHSENPRTLSTPCFKLRDNYTAIENSYIIPTTKIQIYLDLVLKERLWVLIFISEMLEVIVTPCALVLLETKQWPAVEACL